MSDFFPVDEFKDPFEYKEEQGSLDASKAAGYNNVAHFILTPGTWIVTGFVKMPSLSNQLYTARLNTTESIIKYSQQNAPYGLDFASIVKLTSNLHIYLQAYTNPSYTGTFDGVLKAVKLHD